MKRLIYVMGIAFAVSMAAILGMRMSSDAMAIVVGIVCGMAASIPTSLFVIYAMRQRDAGRQDPYGQYGSLRGATPYGAGQYPPVVVVTPPAGNGYPYSQGPLAPSLPAPSNGPGTRSFKVIGQENTESLDDGPPYGGGSSFWDEVN